MIQDLKNIIIKFDKVAKSYVFSYDAKSSIVVANSKKTFDIYHVRFTLAIALLDFADRHIISNLWRTLREQLWFKMTDCTNYTLFSQYFLRCCQCDLDLCNADRFGT